MNLTDVMQAIEGHQFAAEMNLVSGSVAFYRALRDHILFRELVNHLEEPRNKDAISNRLLGLAAAPVDVRYENPFDIALVTYLEGLNEVERPERLEGLSLAVSRAPNCWWAKDSSTRLHLRISRQKMLNTQLIQGQALASQSVGLGSLQVMMTLPGPSSHFNGQLGTDSGLGSNPGSLPAPKPERTRSVRGREKLGNLKDRGSKRPSRAA